MYRKISPRFVVKLVSVMPVNNFLTHYVNKHDAATQFLELLFAHCTPDL